MLSSRLSERQPHLKRELGLRDITLYAIACMVGTRWITAAAHAGTGSILLWLLAALFTVIPVAIATASLTLKHPQAGGIYIWTRGDFGPWHGFLAFWTYWMGIAFWFPSAAMFYMSIAIAMAGPKYERLAGNRTWLVVASLAAIWIALGTNLVGVKVGKWTENAGALAAWILAALLITAAWMIGVKRGAATSFHWMPDFTWDTMSLLGTVAYGMTGFEALGLMGGEIRHVKRDMPRAAWLSSIFVTLFYAGSTMALLVILRPANISELNGLSEVGMAAGQLLSARWLAPLIALLVLASAIGQFGGLGSAVSRMPFAASVDHLLPAAFGKIHPRWCTPYVSILMFGVLSSVLLVGSQFGDTARAAYQVLVSLMVIAGFLPYLYMFGSSWRAGNRVSSLAGWLLTALAILSSVVPSAEVHNIWLFEFKVAAGTIAVIVSAWLVYRNAAVPHEALRR